MGRRDAMRGLGGVAAAAMLLGGSVARANHPLRQDEVMRVLVPAGQPQPVYTLEVLENGRCYVITANGTFGVWTGYTEGMDAYFGHAEWRWGPKPVAYDELLLDDVPMRTLAREHGDPVDYNPDHSYATWIIGTGKKLKLQIWDALRGSWRDNSRGLEVIIKPCTTHVC